ncbi:MAG: TylF/MycF family methyltransferase, partial [Oscillospiraceae bacterium]|nr:TylF/MycF family methyltransferase [Oscillospiraceae bacterium]
SSYSDGTQNFANTSVNLVLNKMPYPAQCEIIKGYFPDSLSDLPLQETLRFCFVSIDVDLYKPIYEGLCYFYPKLCKGGYILLHDYNCPRYKGVKAAVHQFAKENAISYVPIPDESGSVVIAKPLT